MKFTIVAALAFASRALASTPAGTGTNNGYYYSFWTDGAGSVTYNNDAAGAYDVTVCSKQYTQRLVFNYCAPLD